MDAIKAVGKDKSIDLAETKAFGCSIKFPKQGLDKISQGTT